MPEFVSNNDEKYIVTKIIFQGKKKDRRSVFLNGEFAFGIGPETFAVFPLTEGQVITGKQVQVIQFHEEYEHAKELAVRYLAIRMRSRKELEIYLARKQIPKPVLRRVIQYCTEHHYLDDTSFAEAFIRDQINLNQTGILKIKAALLKKGITKEIIEDVLKTVETEIDELATALCVGQKKLKTLSDDKNRKQKLIRFLIQRGYRPDTIFKAVAKLIP